jgi:recombination protein U
MTLQLVLQGIDHHTSHANRGREFQTILNNTHVWYERQRWGKVYEIPNAYSYVPYYIWNKAPAQIRARTEVYQECINGRMQRRGGAPLMRVKSAPDYLGSVLGLHVEFDAKEFAGASISIENFKQHQIDHLYQAERAGALAGFMVLEKRTESVYWVAAGYAYEWMDQIRTRRAAVAKSINFAKVQDKRIWFLCRVERNSLAHYAPLLVPNFNAGSRIAA